MYFRIHVHQATMLCHVSAGVRHENCRRDKMGKTVASVTLFCDSVDLCCPTPLGTTVTMTVTMTGRAARMHLPEVVVGSACGMTWCLFAASQMLAWEAGHASRVSGQDSARCSGRPSPPRVRKQFHFHGDLNGRVAIPTLASNLLLQSSTCIIGDPHLGHVSC